MKKLIALFCLIAFGVSADVKLPSIIGDHMILQQKSKNTLWGWASPGEKITVKASWGSTANTTTDKDGRWKLFLDTPKFATGHTLTISGKNTINIKNVAIGEVWLCAGQSNMGWSMGNSYGGEEEAKVANMPNLRIFKSQREHWHKPLEIARDKLAKWSPSTAESASFTSAVSYYFAKKLHKELNIPVGIIVQAYAGTPIEGWMPKGIQMNDPRTIAEIKSLEENTARLKQKGIATVEGSLKKFEKELQEYNAKIAAGETMKNKVKILAPPTITKPSTLGHQYPSHIFNAMIYPIRPYGIRGMIWYQGERNSKTVQQALNYRKQLAQLISYYRSSWHELSGGNTAKDFPFFFTQLPSWGPQQKEPVEGLKATWAVTRDIMRLVTQEVPNTGMSVSIDTGDEISLHPKNKKPIGTRHAYNILNKVYKKNIVPHGPFYKSHKIDGNKLVINFTSVGSGLIAAKSSEINTFAIAGEDKKWHWAKAEIVGNTIVLSSDEVSNPVAARYAWSMNPSKRNLLYNKEGLPASPFRTDDWPLYEADAEEVRVDKPSKPEGYQAKDWERPTMTQ